MIDKKHIVETDIGIRRIGIVQIVRFLLKCSDPQPNNQFSLDLKHKKYLANVTIKILRNYTWKKSTCVCKLLLCLYSSINMSVTVCST